MDARYERQIILPGIGEPGQQKLLDARVLVVGAGGLGCPVLQYLAAAGIGVLGISDGDLVCRNNLNRQILYYESDIGKPKTEVCLQRLEALNPGIRVTTHPAIQPDNALQIVTGYDIIVDCTDNFPARYLLNDACVMAGKPLVHASIYLHESSLTVLNYLGSDGMRGPTYRCLYPNQPLDEEIRNCASLGVFGSLTGITGCMQAGEVIKMITGAGDVLSGILLQYDSRTGRTRQWEFHPDPRNYQIGSLSSMRDTGSFSRSGFKGILAEELGERILKQEKMQIIDTRSAHEYAQGHIPGSISIPAEEMYARDQDICREVPVILYCKSGFSSQRAIRILEEKFRFDNLVNLQDGYSGWKNLQERRLDRSGHPA